MLRFLIPFFIIPLFLNAQSYPRLEIPFTVNNRQLEFAGAGGLNAPQFSAVDLNRDGRDDLYLFDRNGDLHLTFLSEMDNGQVRYRYAPQYESWFPEVKHWVLLRDYDMDGVVDLWTESSVPGIFGIEVYKGAWANGRLVFTQVKTGGGPHDILYFPGGGGNFSQIYVSTEDYPAIDDIDGDEDLDIVTFNAAGGYIEYYRNQSVERGFGTDSLIYTLEDFCWGRIFESGLQPCVHLSDNANDCATGLVGGGSGGGISSSRHAGSTLLTFDHNGNGLKDLLLGDISFENLIFVENGGTPRNAFMIRQDCSFPSYDRSAEIQVFPASYYIDIDQDGRRDLVVTSNNAVGSEDHDHVLYYRDAGTGDTTDFQFQMDDLLVGNMIDLGSGANPAFVDYNGDGLQDLVVGNLEYFKPFGEIDPRLALYQNVGTDSEPSYELLDDDWLNFSDLVGSSNVNLTPTFGDLDGDGDLDLLVGESSGKLYFGENRQNPGQAMNIVGITFNYMDIDVGTDATPFIYDVNEDGLLDLVIGEKNGNLNYFQNVGTATQPMFNADQDMLPNNSFFGKVDTRELGFTSGYSAPVLMDHPDGFRVVTGSQNGRLISYLGRSDALGEAFTLEQEKLGLIRVGSETRPALADIDGDGLMELFVGNLRGGLSFFQTDFAIDGTVGTENPLEAADWSVYPNPAQNVLWISGLEAFKKPLRFRIYNSLGQWIQTDIYNGENNRIDLENMTPGLYYLTIEQDGFSSTRKFVKR